MKKYGSILLVICLCGTFLVGCGKTEKPDPDSDVKSFDSIVDTSAPPKSTALEDDNNSDKINIAPSTESDDFVIEDGVLIQYKGSGGDVIIPDGVTVLGFMVFFGTDVTSVIIPDGVEKTEAAVFMGCQKLTNVEIPNSMTFIGGNFCTNCPNLNRVTIPDSVTEIIAGAFDKTIVICGADGSYAETYARENGNPFDNGKGQVSTNPTSLANDPPVNMETDENDGSGTAAPPQNPKDNNGVINVYPEIDLSEIYPDYEGEKDGFTYWPGLGYMPNDNKTDSGITLPSWEEVFGTD